MKSTVKYTCGVLAASLLTVPLALTTPATASASAAGPIKKSCSRWVKVPGVPVEAKTCVEQKTDASGSQSRISTGARYHYDGDHPVWSIFTEQYLNRKSIGSWHLWVTKEDPEDWYTTGWQPKPALRAHSFVSAAGDEDTPINIPVFF
ncbi:hypothetical protein [Streptomyces sp. NPDC058989]|uniref:hypothetical protein n=1 Tax=Streptomyces sp. NPDC058989 TaxID=3346686 RepID=UPI0036BF3D58